MQVPLVLGERDAVRLHVRVGELDECGARSLSVYSCVEGVAGDGLLDVDGASGWVCHAVGSVGSVVEGDGLVVGAGEVLGDGGVWPPVGAEVVLVGDVYDRLAGIGLEYGPVFQGLGGVWRLGSELFVEVSLADGSARTLVLLVCIRRCWTRFCTRWFSRMGVVVRASRMVCRCRFLGVMCR